MIRTRYQALSKSEKRAFWLATFMASLFGIFQITLIDTFMTAPNLQYKVVNIIPALLSINTFFGAILIFSGQVPMGSRIVQIGTLLILLVNVTQAEGFGFPAAFIILAVTLYIPLQVLQEPESSSALWLGIIGTIGIIIIDTFWNATRVPALAQDVFIAVVLSIILAAVLVFSTLSQFRTFTINTKLLFLAMGTGLVSIILVSIFVSLSTRQVLTSNTRNRLAFAAQATMQEIDTYIDYNIQQISSEAQLPDVIQFMESTPKEQELLRDNILSLFSALSQRDPNNIGSYSLMDINGLDIVDTYTKDIGVLKSNRDYFITPKLTGNPFVSPVRYSPTSPDHAIYIGVPVTGNDGEFLGVLRVRFRSSLLNEILLRNNENAGEGSFGILLDEYNIIIAHSNNPEWVSRTPADIDISTAFQLQSDNRILTTDVTALTLDMPDFTEKLRTFTNQEPFFTSTDLTWGAPVEVGMARSGTTLFKVAYVQPQAIALRAVTQQLQLVIVIALVTGVLILLVSIFVTRTITQPITDLSQIAENIASGNLGARAQYDVDDELGALARSFNRMTRQLQDTLSGLERRVAERTADLDMARLLSERRAQELQSISEISRTISSEQRLDILLPLITKLVSERFDFYHIGIFFVEETRRFVNLQAANSPGGQIMLARGHRLEIGEGLVGNAAKTGKPRIALDVGTDAVFFNNPDLPNTRSEMALPLNIRGQAIGVLDVQSTKPGAFTENDANTLGILADQIAIAIVNARLFGQTQQARDEAEALYSQILRKEWSAFTQQVTKIGYRQTASGGKYVSKLVDSNEIHQALANGQVVIVESTDNGSNSSIAIPVQLRGRTIGVLSIKAPTKNRRWNQDEVNLAQSVSDRLALALDNARLLLESQRRAAKEAKIGEVSAKIGASININNVLQTAVEELGKALPGSEVIIQFSRDQDSDVDGNEDSKHV